MLHTLQQRIASSNTNGLGERESQRLRDLEASFQSQMQAAAQEWRAQEEAKMEAEIERRTNERLQQSLQSQQPNLQLALNLPSIVGSPNFIHNMEGAPQEMSLDYNNRTREQQLRNKLIRE
jgi:biopolymer transport protein ExbB/TolQ